MRYLEKVWVCFSKTKESCISLRISCSTFSRNFVRLRSIDRGHRDLSTGNRPTRFTMESGLYSPSRIGEDRIAAKARFEEDGCWSCVGNIQRRFVIAKFFLLRNRDCVRTDRRTMYNRLLLFLRFV